MPEPRTRTSQTSRPRHQDWNAPISSVSSGFAVGTIEGKLPLYSHDGTLALSTDLGLGDIVVIRATGSRAVAVARKGIAIIDTDARTVLKQFPISEERVTEAALGPADDEVTYTTDGGIFVSGHDGVLRRKLELDITQSDTPPVWGHGTLFLAKSEDMLALDLRTMQLRTVAKKIYSGPSGSADGSTIAYVDRSRIAHIVDGAGRPLVTFSGQQRMEVVYLSPTGDRIGAIGDRTLTVFDRNGKELRVVALAPTDQELLVRLRGEHIWTASTTGVIRHYHETVLVGSLPSHTAEVDDLRLAGDHLVSTSYDGSIVVQTADVRQLVLQERPCEAISYTLSGPAVGYVCPDGNEVVVIGRRRLGLIRDTHLDHVAFDHKSQRSAIVGKELTVFDPQGAVIATAGEDYTGAVAFEDADHLLVLRDVEKKTEIWRFTLPDKTWARVSDVLPVAANSIVVAAGRTLVGGDNIVVMRGGKEVQRIETGGGAVDSMVTSADGRWVSAHLQGGATVIIDATTGAIDRRLEPVENYGMAAVLDETGDLVVRTSRGMLTIWERSTGDNLVWNLEFLYGSYGAAFVNGRLELAGERAGVIDLPADNRPVADILREIGCRVPLRVAGSRLESAPVECAAR